MGIENPVHILFIGLVALIVLGPKRLPEVARALGQGIREFRESIGTPADQQTVHHSPPGPPPMGAQAQVVHEPVAGPPVAPSPPVETVAVASQPVAPQTAPAPAAQAVIPVVEQPADAPQHAAVPMAPEQGDPAGG